LDHVRHGVEELHDDVVAAVTCNASLSKFKLKLKRSLGIEGHVVYRLQFNYRNEAAKPLILRLKANPRPFPESIGYSGIVAAVIG
jgi:hypothetical protein